LEELTARMIDGLVMFTPYLSLTYEDMTKTCRRIPFVLVSNELGIKAPAVVFDQRHGTEVAIQHLLDLEHRQIAEISGPVLHVDARMRHEAFTSILQSKGLVPGPSVGGDLEVPGGYVATNKLLALQEPFSAMFVANDRMALGALHALHEHGLRVPEDVSVVGFDDMTEAAYFNPPLTTVRQNLNALAHQSIDYLGGVQKQLRIFVYTTSVNHSRRIRDMPSKAVQQCQCPECQQTGAHRNKELHHQMNLLLSRLDEQQQRWYVALEAKKLGRGGPTLLSQITGMHVDTIRRGRNELEDELTTRPTERVRQPGGGRPPVEKKSLGSQQS